MPSAMETADELCIDSTLVCPHVPDMFGSSNGQSHFNLYTGPFIGVFGGMQVELLDSMLATFRGDARVDVATPRALPDALMRMTHLVLTLYVSLRRNFLLQAELFIQVCSKCHVTDQEHKVHKSLAKCRSYLGAIQKPVHCQLWSPDLLPDPWKVK